MRRPSSRWLINEVPGGAARRGLGLTLTYERVTNCTGVGIDGFRRLVACRPSAGREFGDSIDRKIGKARKHRTKSRIGKLRRRQVSTKRPNWQWGEFTSSQITLAV